MEIVNWKTLDKNDVYCCFSLPLYKFIVAHGLEPIANEVHKRTGRPFSVFMKGDKLQALLTEWTANRPVKDNDSKKEWNHIESGDELNERKD